ncbi:MAG: vWA domain-containing protein [Thermacetogeniaceae bacterium]
MKGTAFFRPAADDPAVLFERLHYVEETMKKILLEIFEKRVGVDVVEQTLGSFNPEQMEFYQLDKPEIYQLEIEEIKRRIAKLSRKLACRYARRYRKAKHGRIDLRRTIANAMKTGGIPITLKHRKRIISKPEIVLLCDVSGSVAVFSEFMLQLVYTIQNKFRAVRSFLFIDAIDEVTDCFLRNPIEEAIGEAFANAKFAFSGFSDYGRVFAMFVNKYLPTVSPKSTVIILGDARNNGYPDDRKFLEKIRNRVKRVLWFNPQPQEQWDKEDSIMSVYAQYCDQVFECRNLKQLEKAVEAIV